MFTEAHQIYVFRATYVIQKCIELCCTCCIHVKWTLIGLFGSGMLRENSWLILGLKVFSLL